MTNERAASGALLFGQPSGPGAASGALLIRGGRVVDPARGVDAVLDVLVEDGVIVKVGERLAPGRFAETLDAEGLVVAPGFVDLHAHLREPGREHEETIASGTRAAAAGGFTTVCALPDTDPVVDDAAAAAFVVRRIRETAVVRVHPYGALSRGRKGVELAEIGSMKHEGIVALSDSPRAVANGNLVRRALEYASMFDLPVVVHAEDSALLAGGVFHEGWQATRLGLAGMPAVAETSAIFRDGSLSALTRARLHVAQVSARASVATLRSFKAAGAPVSASVTPHHLVLTDEDAVRSAYDTRFKMSPPLREAADRETLIEGLLDGTIDAISTGHTPNHEDELALEFADAPFGAIGFETALPVLLDALVATGRVPLVRLVDALSAAPARLLGLPGGTLAEGAPADLVLFSTSAPTVFVPDQILSKCRNTPFLGKTFQGAVVVTFVGGRQVFRSPRFGKRS